MPVEKRDSIAPFARLRELARSVGTGEVSRDVETRGEQRVVQSFADSRRPPRQVRTWFGAVGILAAAAAIIVVYGLQLTRHAVSWTVDGETVSEAPYVSPVEKDAVIRFSEGSEFAVQRGGRLRIAEAGRKTVRAVLEIGATRMRIANHSALVWRVDAGPFSVAPSAVANLMVEWLAGELLRVSIFEGEALVTGTPSPLSLHAGQQVSANSRDGTVEVGPLVARSPSSAVEMRETAEGRHFEEPRAAGPEPVPSATPLSPPPSASPSSGRRSMSWSDAVAGGHYAVVLREAERRGIAQALAEAPLGDLVALADAARLSGLVDIAKRAMLACRSRFGKTTAARDAAFFLGRMADDNERAPGIALPWYETYLSEAPSGHFAAEAFGRKMVAQSRQSGRAAARETAREYSKRFPTGPHAALARELASE